VETEADFTVVEKILGRKVGNVKKSYNLLPEDYMEFIQRLGMDMAYLASVWKLGRKEKIDEQGRSLYVDGTIKSRNDLKTIVDPGDDAIKKRLDEMLQALEGTGIGILWNHWNTPVTVITAVGYETYYTALLTDPDFIRECFNRVDGVILRQLELLLTYPIDAHVITHILATSAGPVMSDDLMEEFEFPYMRRNVGMIRAKGIPVSFHCDGNNKKFFPKMIDMGINCIQAIDPCSGAQDIYELKKLYGDRVALHGGINCELLISGMPDQIRASVSEHIERLSVGGGYVCSSSHDLNELMPIENIWAMIETIHSNSNRRMYNV
jgi:uroporphyrinogen decarboxylase